MEKWSLIIDVSKCHDCNNCFMACKDEFVENDWPPYSEAQQGKGHRWMNIGRRDIGQYPLVQVSYLPMPCQHCDNAPCMGADDGVVYKREDGIVIINPEKAKGRHDLVDACPYGAIYYNEEKDLPQKCTMCAHLLDEGWQEPRCVQACPTGALKIVKVDDAEWDRLKAEEGLEAFHAEWNTSPRVQYKELGRYTKGMVCGSVALSQTDECAEGALVTLFNGENQEIARAETNNYGDFRIQNLDESTGTYRAEIAYPGTAGATREFELKDGLNLGTIWLD